VGKNRTPGSLADVKPLIGRQQSTRKIWRKTPVITAAVTTTGAVIAAVVAGIFSLSGSTSGGTTSPATADAQACDGFRAKVQIPAQVGPRAILTITFDCPPVSGQQYMWVVEADGIGKNNHAEYYPKTFNSQVHAGDIFNNPVSFQDDKIGEQNCFYVISVTTQQYENIQDNLNGNNFTLQLPGVDRVSAPACEKRVN
jgi:hypothetical protein